MKQRHLKLRELGKGTISLLYVDENKIVCEQLRPVLEYFFKHIDIASSCEEALRLYQSVHHDIVVTDIIFKNGSGHTFIDKLKAFDPFLKIIIISSFVERKRILHLVNSILHGYLIKPINVNDLLTQLEKVAALVYEKKMLLFYIDTLEKSLCAEPSKESSLTSTSDICSENGLLVFDNIRRDEAIHRMHYKDSDKISAKSFFEQELMGIETIEDILFCSKELEGIFLYVKLTQEYLNEVANFIALFANDLELSGEFRDIAYALRGLSVTLSELIVEHDFSQNASKMIKTIIDSIIEDLVSWTQHVLIDKDAVDIHYLDASLLANIAQLGLSIKNISHKELYEEELEFF